MVEGIKLVLTFRDECEYGFESICHQVSYYQNSDRGHKMTYFLDKYFCSSFLFLIENLME